MKKYLLVFALMLTSVGMVLLAPRAAEARNDNHPVVLCHKGHTITVDDNAVQGHLGHGDTLGECVSSSSSGSQISSSSSSKTSESEESESSSSEEKSSGSSSSVSSSTETVSSSSSSSEESSLSSSSESSRTFTVLGAGFGDGGIE